jgi:hypothetical protein
MDRGAGDDHAQQQTRGVDRDVAFPAVDLLASIVAAGIGPDGLGPADGGSGPRVVRRRR